MLTLCFDSLGNIYNSNKIVEDSHRKSIVDTVELKQENKYQALSKTDFNSSLEEHLYLKEKNLLKLGALIRAF